MDDRKWDRRTFIAFGVTLGATAVSPPAQAIYDEIKELITMPLPSKVAAVYWTRWNAGIRLTAVPQSYNTLILFAATKGASEGAVVWGQDVSADIKTCRARGQKIVMSCGGAGQGINFASRTESTRFVDSIVKINSELGGTLTSPVLDGVDFNTFEADATPNAPEYLWIAYELRRRFGPGFGITSPPAPWSNVDRQFCRAMINGGAMDYAAPQYYDGPGLSDPNYIVDSVNTWIRDVAAGDARKIVVGFGMENSTNYSTIEQIKSAWTRIESAHPTIRGAFLWQHKTDSDRGWAFANQMIPLIGPSTEPLPPPVVTPEPKPEPTPEPTPEPPISGDKVTIGASSYPLAGTNIARESDKLVVYKDAATTTTNEYGAEAAVMGGKIESIVDRQTTGGPGVAIPPGGYVLSGHGQARVWLLEQAQVGDEVTGNVPKYVSPFYAPKGTTHAQLIAKHNALVEHLGL